MSSSFLDINDRLDCRGDPCPPGARLSRQTLVPRPSGCVFILNFITPLAIPVLHRYKGIYRLSRARESRHTRLVVSCDALSRKKNLEARETATQMGWGELAALSSSSNRHLNETCQSVIPVLQGANDPATRSAGQGARDTADGSSVLPGASRSQPPGRADAAVTKPRGETLIGIWADMRSCKSAMLQPCRPASRQGHPRVQTGSASRPSAIAGVA